jgi:hypothetical protein
VLSHKDIDPRPDKGTANTPTARLRVAPLGDLRFGLCRR